MQEGNIPYYTYRSTTGAGGVTFPASNGDATLTVQIQHTSSKVTLLLLAVQLH